jgi:hypothetical protein
LGFPAIFFITNISSGKKGNRIVKDWTEERLIKNKPVIFDTLKAELTTEDFERYLALRGYRYAHASYKSKTSDKQTSVNYLVDPGPRLYIDTFQIIAADPAIQHIIDSVPDASLITKGSPLDIDLYTKERTRIVRLVQNEGYATFDENYFPQLEVDTSMNRVKAIMRVTNPTDSTLPHQIL